MKTDLTAPHFNDEEAARAHYEAIRWPTGPVCPHCGSINNATKMQGKTTRPGLYKCKEKECRKPFTATMGSIYEKSHIPLHKWLLATHIMCASKKGVSAHQLWRMLGFGSYKTAWFMAHRIREAMRAGDMAPPMGGGGGTVEADETYFGLRADAETHRAQGRRHLNAVFSLVDRTTGEARSFVLPERMTMNDVGAIMRANIAKETRIVTDESKLYGWIPYAFADHGRVNHSKREYVSKNDPTTHTNTIEGFYSVFKRGMRGVYQHCGEQHLHRYLAEFDFRYSNRIACGVDDNQRALKAIQGTVGRRLTYRPLAKQSEAQA
ncbi:MAG: IS1595 family transposase [Hyphomonadaceae bacterium]|nr:IS1595 family transposase [Hyphomonadaceae bacterium]